MHVYSSKCEKVFVFFLRGEGRRLLLLSSQGNQSSYRKREGGVATNKKMSRKGGERGKELGERRERH